MKEKTIWSLPLTKRGNIQNWNYQTFSLKDNRNYQTNDPCMKLWRRVIEQHDKLWSYKECGLKEVRVEN